MEKLYRITSGTEETYPLSARVQNISKNWWSLDVMSRSAFEDREHELEVIDTAERDALTDDLQDLFFASPGILGVSERAWELFDQPDAVGCRIARKVSSKGHKRYRLVYPGLILDLLDHERSKFSWNGGLISWIQRASTYNYDSILPLAFQLLLHNKEMMNGLNVSPSMAVFVSQTLFDEYKRLGLTGLEFVEVGRSDHPDGPKKMRRLRHIARPLINALSGRWLCAAAGRAN